MSSIQRPLTDEEQVRLGLITEHDTPASPHREHMPQRTGAGGGGGPIAHAANDAAVDITAQLGGDETYQTDVANAFGTAFREVGRPPGDQEGFADWANGMTAEIAGQLHEQGQFPGDEAEAAQHKNAIYSAVVDHFQGGGGSGRPAHRGPGEEGDFGGEHPSERRNPRQRVQGVG